MDFFDPHIHVASRTTDDLKALAEAGCVGVAEPAFWMGFDRSGANSFYDYFRQLTEWEPNRCAQFNLPHYCWMGINAKEAEDVGFAREVIALLPEFLERSTVLGIGEIGLNKNTRNEVTTLLALMDLAVSRGEQMLFHTPHLEHKYQGTRMILDLLRDEPRVDRHRVVIDHCEEHTIRLALDEGYWAGITLYPTTKASPERAADMVERYGPERILVNSSADWGPSDPLSVPRFMGVMRRR
ncbi:MAG: TatD family hydrolase, partial [Planctomycetota bacterium]